MLIDPSQSWSTPESVRGWHEVCLARQLTDEELDWISESGIKMRTFSGFHVFLQTQALRMFVKEQKDAIALRLLF